MRITALIITIVTIGATLLIGLRLGSERSDQDRPRPGIGAMAPAGSGGGGRPAESRSTASLLTASLGPFVPVEMVVSELPPSPPAGFAPPTPQDRGPRESILTEAEEQALRDEALRLPPDPSLARAAGSGRAPVPGSGFTGLDFTTAGEIVPPDPAIAAGPDHLITVTNVAIQMFDTAGATVFGPTAAGTFFSGVPSCTSDLFDPDVLFDEEHERYILGFGTGPEEPSGGYCMAVSQSADPLGSWNLYFFGVNTASEWLDFPHAGVADDHIAFGGNLFDYSGPPASYVESRAWAAPKADLYAGNPVVIEQVSMPGFEDTPQPLHLHGFADGSWPDHGDDVYLLTEPYDGRNYSVQRWDVATGSITTVGTVDLGGNPGFPVPAPQSGGEDLKTNDWRPHGFEYRSGFGWFATTIACNPGAGTVNCARWAQVDLATATLGPQGAGTITADGEHRFYPALAVNRCGDMAIGYTLSSASSFAGVALTGRLADDPPGSVGAEEALKAGEITYTAYDGIPTDPNYRWGDYTGMAISPDGGTFWSIGQYSKDTGTTTGRWGTWVVPLTFDTCPPGLIFANGFEGGDLGGWS